LQVGGLVKMLAMPDIDIKEDMPANPEPQLMPTPDKDWIPLMKPNNAQDLLWRLVHIITTTRPEVKTRAHT
jgi:hypothetical protein